MPYQLSDINTGLRSDPKGFLEQCDAAYQSRISAAVDRILERMKVSPIVLLSGPSGSGKTTTALKLEQELERRGVNSHTISMDNYFKTLNRKTAPRTPEGDIDFESPKLLDMDLLDDTFTRLSRGDWVIVPKFEFARQMRNDSRGTPPIRISIDRHFRGHPRPERRHLRPPSGGHRAVHLRPLQCAGGGGTAVQGHLDAHFPPGGARL